MPTPPPPKSNRDRYVGSTRIWEENLRKRPAPSRAEKLVPNLKAIFRKQGIPEELVWLAEVESSFNPAARSPVGAAGLYQFMPKTAESLGLDLRPRDERLIPERSAEAAATYLKLLYKRFNTWPLPLAAYNAGQGRVSKLLKRHEAGTFDEISAFLPSETRMYVPKVFATIKLREGIGANSLPPPSRG
jgi:membrane-bound lytic murein transglycosylase D